MTTQQITKCGNCGKQIGKIEPAHEWQDSVVCDQCYHELRKARMRQTVQVAQKAKSGSAKTHKAISGSIAILGVILTVVGAKLYTPGGSSVGFSDGRELILGGVVITCLGLLWFAAARFMGQKD